MRTSLAARNGARGTYVGVFARLGRKSGWGGTTDLTILLQDIRDAALANKVVELGIARRTP